MRRHLPTVRSGPSAPEPSPTLQGSLAYVLVLGGVLLAASYPVIAAAVGAGIVATVLVQRVLARIDEPSPLPARGGATEADRVSGPVPARRRPDRAPTIEEDPSG